MKKNFKEEEKLVSKTNTTIETFQNKWNQVYTVTTVYYSDKTRKLFVNFHK